MIRSFSLVLALLLLWAGTAMAVNPTNATEFLDLVEADVNSGLMTAEEGLMIKFHYVFDQSQVPARYQVEGFAPLKCATPMVAQFEELRSRMSRDSVEQVENYLQEEQSRLLYNSPGGHFQLTYVTTGSNAVPLTDTNPANGIPDYVEKIALYFDESWDVEVEENGFQRPPIGTGYYQVSFADQTSYGYTTIVNASSGLTRIVMHPSFTGFPPNNDPEGNVWGAAKVTAAHEFKHATQFATSRWQEGGWNEVDAVWAEELVYDVVDDYYNYLTGESPIRHPEISLDGGSTGTGSYEDCVFEMWMSQAFGNEIIYDYWEHRRTNYYEPVMESWEEILGTYGVTLAEGWAQFTAWNYGTGYRGVPGVGYDEASDYPYGNFVSYATSYPFSYGGAVGHLAANFVRLMAFDGETEGTLDIEFDGADTGGAMTVGIHIEKQDGTGAIETMTLDENNDGYYVVQVPLQDIAWAGLAVGNAAISSNSLHYSVSVYQTEAIPVPTIELDSDNVAVNLEANQTTTEMVSVSNNGEDESVLNYDVAIWGNSPLDDPANKTIAGSTLTSDITSYLPGTSFAMNVTVYNGSQDEEWLMDVTMDFPAGVTVVSATNYVGGFYGPLVHDGALGDGAYMTWHGEVGANHYGVIREEESAVSTITITVDPSFSGDLDIPSTIGGDTFGADPHTLYPTITLTQADPELIVTYPNGGEHLIVGDSETITWDSLGGIDNVDIDVTYDGGDTWHSIATNQPNNGSYDAVVGDPGSIHCLIRLSDPDGVAVDTSDAEFSIIETVNWLTVAPMSGAVNQGDSQDLTLSFDSAGQANGVHTAWLYITNDGATGPMILPVSMSVTGGQSPTGLPSVFALNGNYPNPFNPMTKISFSLPAEAHTSVEVLDIRGRVVRNLYVGTMAEGEQQLSWDGRDDDGQTVAAGLYLARLRTVGYEATVKMTLAK